jgi:hypothetical protein
MATVQLLGRETYGPQIPMGYGVSPLWSYFKGPPAQNSVLVYNDGTVIEGPGFENDDIQNPDVHVFILGGTRFRCEVGSFAYGALTAAGYSWQEIAERDTYTGTYQDVY